MKLLCKMFGHKSNEWVFTGAEYMYPFYTETDGLGVKHVTLFGRCSRCGENYRMGRLHLKYDPLDKRSQ